MGVTMTVSWEAAKGLPAQREPSWIPQERGREETGLIPFESVVAFARFDRSNTQSLGPRLPPAWEQEGKGGDRRSLCRRGN